MSQTVIELPCGASIITTKVCGRYYLNAKQICTGKSILALTHQPVNHVREARKWLRSRLELRDWTKVLTEEQIEDLYHNWLRPTEDGIRRISNGCAPE